MSTDTDKRRMGPFQLESRLGVGGMGIVYRATYLKTGQQVALKVLAPDLSLDPKVAKRFEREMDILRKLKHAHIIRYYGGSTTGAQRYYAMELLSGGALDTVLKKKGKFTWEEAVEYALQIAKALEHAHNASVIHRDLKPSNLLLTKDNKLKLSDFGIARDTQATQLTAAGKTVGTMAYMAPEQITGKQPVSRKTDLYALGCVLFEMLTGRPPFQSETQPELLFKHIEEAPPSVREFNMDVPLWLDRLIGELLEKDPNDRPFDALAVQVKLEEIKQKAAERASIVAQTVAEGGAASTIKNGDRTIAGLLGGRKKKRKKKKKGDQSPIYERAWFLAIPLVAIVALVVWKLGPQLIPESEAEVYARVQPLMSDPDPGVWLGAEDDVRTLVEKFPEGEHAEQAQKWLADIKVEVAVRQFEKIEMQRPNYSPETESEKLYVQALQYEKLGDRVGALETYDSMRTVLKFDTSDKGRAIQALAQRNAQKLRAEGEAGESRIDFVRKLLREGDELYRSNPLEAREKWRSIVGAYGGKQEFEPVVRQAEQRLDNPEKALAEASEKSESAPDAPE